MDIGGGGLPAQFNYADGNLMVAGADGGMGTNIAVIDGELDLGALVGALQAEGFDEASILANLDGIVASLEAAVDFQIKGKEAYADYLSDKFESVEGSTTVEGSVIDGVDETTELLLNMFSSEGAYINPGQVPTGFDPSSPLFTGAVDSLNGLLANPGSAAAASGFQDKLAAYLTQFPHGDVMGGLFLVFKESIEQTNKDKRYFLERLADMNKIAEAVGDYLEYLTERSNKLQAKTRDTQAAQGKDFQPGSVTVSVDVQRFDINSVGADGKAVTWTKSNNQPMNDTDMGYEIKNVETIMEEVRNKRQEFTTAFENFDQKANQLFNILSTVLKNVKEMESGVTRNLL